MAVQAPPPNLKGDVGLAHQEKHTSLSSAPANQQSNRTNPLLISSSYSSHTPDHSIPHLEPGSQSEAESNSDRQAGPSLQKLLHQPLQITLSDSRIILGYLLCIDREGNIILRDSEEYKPLYPVPVEELNEEEIEYWDKFRENRELYWPQSEPFNPQPQHTSHGLEDGEGAGEQGEGGVEGGWGGRNIGMVSIRKKDVKKIEIRDEIWERLGGKIEESRSKGFS